VGSGPCAFGQFIGPPTCVAPPSGIISWWSGDGHPFDIVGTNDGTMMNGATYADGRVGKAFSFGGSGDYLEVAGGVGDFGSNPFTVDFWIFPSNGGANTPLLGKSHANGGIGWDIRLDSSTIQVVGVNGWTFNITSNASVTPETWHHIALSSTDTNVYLYINGDLEGSCARSAITSTTNPFRIGYLLDYFYSGPEFNGLIDEVEIFNRALSAEEIAAIYAAGSAGMCTPTPIPTYTITASVPGGNGTIDCTSPVNQGDSSTCTISPDPDYHLATLTDNDTSVIGSVSGGQYVISNVTADHDVIGTFSIDTFPLSITLQGTGTGTVTSNPAGINCGSTCDGLFDSGTLVTLTTTPAIGSFLAGWSGDCNADGEVTMNATKSCTATFTAYTALQVQAPNGGEDLMAGQSYTIRWGAPAAMETFDILYSLDGGLTWKKQTTRAAGNSYPWTLPVPAGSGNKKKCLVKVIGYNGQGAKVATDTSDRTFVINLLRLDSLNGGHAVDAGATVPVTWTRRAGLAATMAKVYYSLNQGLTWVYSGQANADAGQYDWEVPLTKKPTATCRVKVTLFNGATVAGSDKSDANVTIRTVEVLDPNGGGEPLTGGQPYDVLYYVYTRNPYARADVYLSLDGGQTWKLAGQHDPVTPPALVTLSVNVPAVTTTKKNCKLKVQLVDEEIKMVTKDTSNAVFTISPR
jgi:hypothetical protein